MNYGKCIVSGYVAGKKFRPSNWPERLCEAGATMDPVKRVMRYSTFLYPRQCDQHGCSIYVDFDGLEVDVARYVGWFIDSNSLEVYSLDQPFQIQDAVKSPMYHQRRKVYSKAA